MAFMDYALGEVLYSGSHTRVVRATHKENGERAVLKLPLEHSSSPRTLEKLEHEYAVLKDLDTPGVIRTRGLETHDQGVALVLEPWGEMSLDRSLRQSPLSTIDALHLAAAVARALGAVHRRNIIHRDIKPQNILIDAARTTVRLIDFGIATRWSYKVDTATAVEALAGTLAYMAPEQTGRMNRIVDTRADLYALGATLYEMLTGALPFETSDALSLIHAHVARAPSPPHERTPERAIPEAVSAIVLKLMANSPEDRYQTADGAAFDLEHAASAVADGQIVAPFELATRDWEARLRKPSRLFGRERETAALESAFERAARGAVLMALVAGPSGVGKSALALALRECIRARHGIFAPGKFDQLQRSTPYIAVAQALRTVVRRRLADSTQTLERWKQAWQEAAGPNGRILVDLMPELAHILGETKPLVELGPIETRLRFQSTVQRFVRTIATAEHPLLLFIDDLQWADPASLSLLRELLLESGGSHLLVVGAYRDDEVGAEHPLHALVGAATEKGAVLPILTLAPLDQETLSALVANVLGRPECEIKDLSRLVKEKTDGSPFFASRFLETLREQALLSRDLQTGQWHWERDAIEHARITDNVVTLLTHRLRELSPEVQQLLQMAACIGDRFDLELVAHLAGTSPDALALALAEAIGEGMLVHEGEVGYETYAFVHDRVQQAAYEARSPEERVAAHLSIGRMLRARYGADDELFATLYHRNRALALVWDPAEKRDLAVQNLSAGQGAKTSAAYTEALRFFRVAQQLIGPDGWTADPELTIEAHVRLGEAHTLGGQLDVGDELFKLCVERARDELERAWVVSTWLPYFVGSARIERGVELGIEAMGWLGRVMPKTAPEEIALHEQMLAELAPVLEKLTTENWRAMPWSDDRAHQLRCKILESLASCAVAKHPPLATGCRMMIVDETLKHGMNENSPGGGSTTGALMLLLLGKVNVGRQLCESMVEIVHRRDLPKSLTLFPAGHVRAYVAPLSDSAQAFRDTARIAGEESNAYESMASALASYHDALHGRHLPYIVQDASGKTHRNQLAVAWQSSLVRTLTVLSKSGGDVTTEFNAIRESAAGSPILNLYAGGVTSWAALHAGADEWAARTALANEVYWKASYGSASFVMLVFALTVAGAHSIAALSADEQQKLRERLDFHGDRLSLWVESCPQNFRHVRLLMDAGLARSAGRHDDAARLYAEAIDHAHRQERVHDKALALRLAGEHHVACGRAGSAQAHLTAAYLAYVSWGALACAERIRERHPDLVMSAETLPEPTKRVTSTSTAEGDKLNVQLDANSVLLAAQALSSDRELGSLIGRVLHLLAENAGAERAVLALVREGELRVEAELKVDPGQLDLDLREPVIASLRLPATLVQYVARGQEPVVLGQAAGDSRFDDDPFLVAHRPSSVLAVPLVHQGRLSGVMYLEHTHVEGAFPEARVQLVTMLASQAATAVENATLYAELSAYNERLESEVEKRTAELVLSKEAADAANRAKSQFLSSMSHELRTPLNGILGYAQVLERLPELAPKAKESVRIIIRSGEHLLKLINDVLDLAKIEAGRMDFSPREVDFASVLQTVANMCRLRADEKHILFKYELVGPAPEVVRTDEKLLMQLLINLLGNAIKFTDRGSVTLRVEVASQLEGELRSMRFLVSDTGSGIANDQLARIFEPFEQGGNRKSRAQGTGLGLSITRRIVEHMGGKITVESQLGKGSTFALTLALPEGTTQAANPERDDAWLWTEIVGYDGPRRRVLVVDDNDDNRTVIRDLLSPLGFLLHEAGSGEAALTCATSVAPDVVIMDLAMVGLDGYETTRRLRRLPELQRLVIVASSAGISATVRDASKKAGCDDFLPKPVRAAELLTLLERHLKLAWARKSAVIEASRADPATLVAPPLEIVRKLREQIQRGRLNAVIDELKVLETHAPAFGPWIRHVLRLAERFQIKKIRELLQTEVVS